MFYMLYCLPFVDKYNTLKFFLFSTVFRIFLNKLLYYPDYSIPVHLVDSGS